VPDPSPTHLHHGSKIFSQITGARLLAAAFQAQPDTPKPAVFTFHEPLGLIFQDESEGDRLNPDLWRSLEYGEQGMKRGTAVGRLLAVRMVNRGNHPIQMGNLNLADSYLAVTRPGR